MWRVWDGMATCFAAGSDVNARWGNERAFGGPPLFRDAMADVMDWLGRCVRKKAATACVVSFARAAVRALLRAGYDIPGDHARSVVAWLATAVEADDVALACALLDAGVDPTAGRDDADQPLAGCRSVAMLDAVVARGADLDIRCDNNTGDTLLMVAAADARADIVAALLARGADPHATDAYGDTALAHAASPAAARLLVEAGLRVDASIARAWLARRGETRLRPTWMPGRRGVVDTLCLEAWVRRRHVLAGRRGGA